jgi:hypothetical protein
MGRAHHVLVELVSMEDARVLAYRRAFEKPLIAAAVLTIPATILQNTPVGEPWDALAIGLNWLIWLAFLAELVVMLAVVPSRTEYYAHIPSIWPSWF